MVTLSGSSARPEWAALSEELGRNKYRRLVVDSPPRTMTTHEARLTRIEAAVVRLCESKRSEVRVGVVGFLASSIPNIATQPPTPKPDTDALRRIRDKYKLLYALLEQFNMQRRFSECRVTLIKDWVAQSLCYTQGRQRATSRK